MQASGFRKLKQRQSMNRCPPETLLLFFLVLITGLNPCEPDMSGAIVSAVPHADIFEPKCNPESSWLLVEVFWEVLECHSLASCVSHPPVLCLSVFMSGSHPVLISFVGPVRELPCKVAFNFCQRCLLLWTSNAHFHMHPMRERLAVLHSPFSSCAASTLLDLLFPLLKTRFWNGRGRKGASCGLSKKKEPRFRCLHEGLSWGRAGSRREGARFRGVTEENSFDVACGWHYYFSFKNRDTVAGKPKMLAHVSLAVEIISNLFSVA
ncbi:uncharacterized [Tachysurus ichikawai]